MQKFSRKKSLAVSRILMASIAVTGTLSAGIASAQEALEEMVITGIRGSLTNSMDLKRDADGIVDAITAEDIGKFPDANLAESLQRITGVSIDRQNNEGAQITVRGFGPSFNLVTLNGRQMPVASSPEQESIASATQSRGFNFNEIAPESVSAVEIYKTSRAYLPTGGLGATVNIKTARPFDYNDQVVVGSLTAIHDSSVEEGDSVTPEISGLYSNTFADGKFGVLANLSYSKRQWSELSTHTDGWIRDGQSTDSGSGYFAWCNDPSSECNNAPYVYRPVTQISEIKNYQRRRTNGQLVAQFAPNDRMVLTLDYVISNFERDEYRIGTGLFGTVAGSMVQNTRLTDTFTVQSVDRIAFAADALVYDNELVIENESIGLHFDWQVNDALNLEFDVHSSSAESQPKGELNDNNTLVQGPLGVNHSITYSPDGVDIIVDASAAFRGEDQFGNGDRLPDITEFQDIDGFAVLGSVLRTIAINNEVDQFQFTANWQSDDVSLTAGASYTDYQVETNATNSGFVFQNLFSCPQCADLFTRFTIDAPSAFDTVVGFDVDAVKDLAWPTSDEMILAQFPPTFFGTSEESMAFFFNIATNLEIAAMPARINAGIRYEDTDVTGSAFQTFPVSLTITSNTEGQVDFAPDATPEFFTIEESYSSFLPSFDFQLNVTRDQVARLSYGRTIARPDLNALRPITTVSDYRPGIATASSGNPGILPYTSDNIDLSYEWYYSEGSYASLAYFYKEVEDYISTEIENDVILDVNGNPLLDPSSRYVPTTGTEVAIPVSSQPGDPEALFAVTRPLNTDSREADGFELAVQHIFGETGFGLQANYTKVDSDLEFDPDNFADQTVLIGLSDSANLVGFYENDKFSVRLAVNWRDEFLFATNQLRIAGEPVYFDAYTQFDFSSSYNINDSLTLRFEILNITGEDQKQRGRYEEHFLFENKQEPRFALGISGRW